MSLRRSVHCQPEPNIRFTLGKDIMFITAHYVYRSPVTLFFCVKRTVRLKSLSFIKHYKSISSINYIKFYRTI